MKLLYTLVAPIWTVDTSTLERRLDLIEHLVVAADMVYEWAGKRYTKDKKKMHEFIDLVKHELRNRRDKTYRDLVSEWLAGRGSDLTILLMAERLTEMYYSGEGTDDDLTKAQTYREWVDKKNNTKVYSK